MKTVFLKKYHIQDTNNPVAAGHNGVEKTKSREKRA